METTIDAPSVLEILVVVAVGFAVVVAGIRSKWKYISQVDRSQFDDPRMNLSRPEINARVRRLVVLYVICILSMAFALLIMILSRSTVFFVIALLFGIIVVFADLFIYLDTSRR